MSKIYELAYELHTHIHPLIVCAETYDILFHNFSKVFNHDILLSILSNAMHKRLYK